MSDEALTMYTAVSRYFMQLSLYSNGPELGPGAPIICGSIIRLKGDLPYLTGKSAGQIIGNWTLQVAIARFHRQSSLNHHCEQHRAYSVEITCNMTRKDDRGSGSDSILLVFNQFISVVFKISLKVLILA